MGAAVPTAGVLRGPVPLGESPTPVLVPFFHLHLETKAPHLPLTEFQICLHTWLITTPRRCHMPGHKENPALSRPLAHSQGISLAHTPAWRPVSVCLTRQRLLTPAAPVPRRALWDTPARPAHPWHQSPLMGGGPQKRAFTHQAKPRAKCCHLRANEQLLTEASWGEVFKSTVAGGTEILLGPGRSKNPGLKTDILVSQNPLLMKCPLILTWTQTEKPKLEKKCQSIFFKKAADFQK